MHKDNNREDNELERLSRNRLPSYQQSPCEPFSLSVGIPYLSGGNECVFPLPFHTFERVDQLLFLVDPGVRSNSLQIGLQ